MEIISDKPWSVVVTILERKLCGTEVYGKYEDPLEERKRKKKGAERDVEMEQEKPQEERKDFLEELREEEVMKEKEKS